MVALDLAGRGVEGDCRRREQIITRPLIAHPRPAIAGAPESEVGFRIVAAGDPHRAAAGLPLVAVGPGLAARLAGGWDGVGLPDRLSGLGIERRDKPTNAELSARDAHHHLAVGDERRQRHVIPIVVVLDLRTPKLLAGLGVDGHEHRIGRCEVDLIAEQPDAAVGRVQECHVLGDRPLEAP